MIRRVEGSGPARRRDGTASTNSRTRENHGFGQHTYVQTLPADASQSGRVLASSRCGMQAHKRGKLHSGVQPDALSLTRLKRPTLSTRRKTGMWGQAAPRHSPRHSQLDQHQILLLGQHHIQHPCLCQPRVVLCNLACKPEKQRGTGTNAKARLGLPTRAAEDRLVWWHGCVDGGKLSAPKQDPAVPASSKSKSLACCPRLPPLARPPPLTADGSLHRGLELRVAGHLVLAECSEQLAL